MVVFVRQIAALLIISLFFLIATGCSGTRSNDPASKTKYSLKQASRALRDENPWRYRLSIDNAIRNSSEIDQVKQFFTTHPDAQNQYTKVVTNHIKTVSSASALSYTLDSINILQKEDLLDADNYERLTYLVAQRARSGNESGAFFFSHDDNLSGLGLAGSSEQMDIVVERNLNLITESTYQRSRTIKSVMEYASDSNTPARHRSLIENKLPELYLNEAELRYVVDVFPDYANLRQKQLDSIGDPKASRLQIGSSAWKSLSESDRKVIRSVVYVEVFDDSSYGIIVDVQAADRSTPATYGGTVVGSTVAEAAYIDRSISHENYSVWSQLGFGILGGIVGSALDSPAKEKYQYRYTVQLANGERTTVNRISSTPFHESVGTCVMRTNLKPISQAACELTIDDVRKKYLIDI